MAGDAPLDTGSAARRPLTLVPFRGLRFDPEVVGDLSTVISPPYDVLDAETVRTLEQANRRNIVRLILSRRFERPYLAVRDRLQKWRDKGALRADEAPTLYVYEYTAEQATVRGLIGLVGLRTEDEGVILPHEDVMPGPVEDRTVLMRTTETNLEPILLVHEGSDRLAALVDDATRGKALADFVALDGSCHRLWAITDGDCHRAIADELAGGTALIADGHHRYAAYLRLQEQHPGTAWDAGLAMLVDQHDTPLFLGAIHRTLPGVSLAPLAEAARAAGAAVTEHQRPRALGALDSTHLVLTDGATWYAVAPGDLARQAAVSWLHEQVLGRLADPLPRVEYHHSVDDALAAASATTPAVLLPSPDFEQVRAIVESGGLLPEKATSFQPKPSLGVLMRPMNDA